MALFRVDFSGRGELSERQQKVVDFEYLFIYFHLAVLITTSAACSGATVQL